MSKRSSYFLGILLTIILGTILYYYSCCNSAEEEVTTSKIKNPPKKAPIVKEATKNPFSIIDTKSGAAYKSGGNFNFRASNFNIITPIFDGLPNQVQRLSSYLSNNPNKALNITGYYTNKETNNTPFPSLGLARANAVKNYFISKGASSKSINIFGKANDDLIPDQQRIYHGPLNYELATIDINDNATDKAIETIGKEIKSNPLVMYFDIGNTEIELSPKQREKVAKIARYIDKTDGASIQIIGHTDNTGSRTNNIKLGQDRANGIKEYFVKNGILESKIQTSSKGPDAPIADNKTKEGQAQNRRVIVTIN